MYQQHHHLHQVADLKEIHKSICPDHELHEPIVQLSLDRISESKSSLNSLDCYSIKFNHCRNIYPIRLIKPCEKYKFNEQEQFQQVLSDINDNEIIIDCTVLDNPKRSDLRCAKCASAKFGCEYCENCAVPFANTSKKPVIMIKKKFKLQEDKICKKN